jgi:hypothetical protein
VQIVVSAIWLMMLGETSVYAATAVYKSFHEVWALSIWDILGATVFFPR